MKLIVVTGPDACGKDTQTELLNDYLKQNGYHSQRLSIWDSFQDFHGVGDPQTLQKVVQTFLLRFSGESRSLFLTSCLKNSLAKILPSTEIAIFNGYFYKYWASELSYGVDPILWSERLKGLFPQPDLTFFLDCPPDVALLRRERWSDYESGLASGIKGHEPKPNLQTFQKRTYQNFKSILPTISQLKMIDGILSKTDVHQKIVESLGKIL